MEIVNGRVNWIWKPESRPDAYVISTKTIVSDNQWHTIKLRNPDENPTWPSAETVELSINNFHRKKSLKAAENNSRAGKWIINIDEKRPNNEILGGPAPESSKWKTFLQDNAVVLGGKSD